MVSTRVLSPTIAVVWAAFFNFIAAFGGGVKVANTMGKGIIHFEMLKAQGTTTVLMVIFAALIGAIVWNLLTWWWGLPSSSSHALAGGMIGATLPVAGHRTGWSSDGIAKIAAFIVLSPLIGMVLGHRHDDRRPPGSCASARRCRSTAGSAGCSSCRPGIFSYSHGTNDAQKTMGIIAVVLYGTIWSDRAVRRPLLGDPALPRGDRPRHRSSAAGASCGPWATA